MTRSEAREILMQILYEMDTSRSMNAETAMKLTQKRLAGNHKERGYRLLSEILEHLSDIDGSLNEYSRAWKTDRMPKVDLAIMRLALGEIRYSDDIPDAVAINEAVELAKKFSMDTSPGFIHGLLGAIVRSDEK